MTPDRLRGWLATVPAGSVAVEMCVDATTGLVELATWERAEVDELRGQTDGDVADATLDALININLQIAEGLLEGVERPAE